MSRITLITYFDKIELTKVTNLIENIDFDMCKVPYGLDDNKRYDIDNLPYHFTIFATDKENEKKILNISKDLKIGKIKLKINSVKIMKTKNNSYILYLGIQQSNDIKKLQKVFYKEIPEEKYNPDKFNFHMTLHIDKNKEVIDELYNILKDNFKPFYIEFDKLTLFNYPGEMIKIIKL